MTWRHGRQRVSTTYNPSCVSSRTLHGPSRTAETPPVSCRFTILFAHPSRTFMERSHSKVPCFSFTLQQIVPFMYAARTFTHYGKSTLACFGATWITVNHKEMLWEFCVIGGSCAPNIYIYIYIYIQALLAIIGWWSEHRQSCCPARHAVLQSMGTSLHNQV